ncbi:hypothetical protein [Nonomuraea sp. NPDC005501]|uniref:hypothetical protein n=1 Tax=Nonomuraea sp. NPDC005501 TaxID=3156884 RepID=UPI0033A98175
MDDQLIKRNHCRIKGADQEKSPERPVLTVAQVYRLVDVIEHRYRTLLLLGTFAGLRWDELTGLRRRDLDLDAGTVKVEHQLIQITGKGLIFTDPRSAGRKVRAAWLRKEEATEGGRCQDGRRVPDTEGTEGHA